MTSSMNQNQDQPIQPAASIAKQDDKELNFRRLEQKYQAELSQERNARLEAEKRALEAQRHQSTSQHEEEDDDEPYVDKKKLNKTLAKFGEQTKHQTQNDIQSAVQHALKEERRQNWIKQNPDFYDILKHADAFAERDPELAETILEMPEGFERQKLVYKNIKALGIHRPPEEKKNNIQDKIDANRRSPYYQPSGVSSGAYESQADFSQAGQKKAYEKMQQMKSRFSGG